MGADDDSLIAQLAASPPRRPPLSLPRGTRRFDLVRRLGAGAFGEVYEAIDRESGGTLAVKVLQATGAEGLFRFKREFRAVADIVHPNLVRLYELIEEDERWYLAMELIDGIAFDEHVQRMPEEARASFAQLAAAIDALHRAGKLHRDLKPSNVLVERTGRVVLLDFGFVLALDSQARSAIAGTPAYMAPEQLRGEELGVAADWYAFGVMIYQALTGRLPFGTTDALLRGEPPPAPSALHRDVEPGLERLCLRLLSPSAADRPGAGEILAALAPSEAAEPVDVPDREPFAGRTAELGELRGALEAVADVGALVLVEGAAGIGKSSLVRTFAGELSARGGLVFAGRCHEAESVPYKGVDAVVDAISEHLRRRSAVDAAAVLPRDAQALATMFPVLKRVDAFARVRAPRLQAGRSPLDTRRAATAAFRELVARLSDAAPVVVFLDDVQWATEDGVHLLLELLAPPTPPALFVVSYRQEALGRTPALDRFVTQAAGAPGLVTRRVVLGPLTAAEVAELVTSEGDRRGDLDLWRESGGHPFLLTRLLQANLDPSLSVGLADVLDQQLQRLAPEARSVLEIVCLSAAPLTQGAACELGGVPRWDPRVIDGLRTARLIRSLGRSVHAQVEPYHDRVREKVQAALTGDARRALNLRIARYLDANRRVDAEAIAQHYAAAQEPELAVAWLRKAATTAATSLAFTRAGELYGRAAALSPASEQGPLHRARGDALVNAGHGQEAARAYEAALASSWSDLERLDLQRRAAEQWLKAGFLEEGLAHLQPVLGAVGESLPPTPGRALGVLLLRRAQLALSGLRFDRRAEAEIDPALLARIDACWAAGLGLANIETVRGMALLTRHLLLSLSAGEPARLACGLSVEAMFSGAAGGKATDRAEALVRTAERLADELEHPLAQLWVRIGRAMVAFSRARWSRARDDLAVALPMAADQPGAAWELGTVQFFTALVRQYLGLLPDLTRDVPRWVDEASARSDRYTASLMRASLEPWVELIRDRPDAAHSAIRRSRDGWTPNRSSFPHFLSWLSTGMVLLYEGRPAEAWALLQGEWSALEQSRMMSRIEAIAIRALEMRLGVALALGKVRGGDRVLVASASADAQRLRQRSVPWAHGLAAQAEAALAHLRGDPQRAQALLAEAERTFASLEMEANRQAVCLRLGQLRGDAALEAEARSWMASRGVIAPERWVGVLSPGW